MTSPDILDDGSDLTPLRLRLRRIAGQVSGIEWMLGEDRSCEDVLIQLAAVQEARPMWTPRPVSSSIRTAAWEQQDPSEEREMPNADLSLVDAYWRAANYLATACPTPADPRTAQRS